MDTKTNAALERLASRLEALLGEDLVALVLYGSAARGDFAPGRSDINLLLILADASPATLRAIGPTLHQWVKTGQPAPLIFSETGWRASTDVFPIEIEDMRQAHRVLKGRDPFIGLETAPADLRQELEREVRGKLLKLRAEYAASGPHPKTLGTLLVQSAPTFFVLLRAVLRLKGTVPPSAPADLVRAAASVVGFDPSAFDWVLARLAGTRVPDLKQFDPIAESYLRAIERLAEFVDEM
jgi:predicted nucleotidyltransferase